MAWYNTNYQKSRKNYNMPNNVHSRNHGLTRVPYRHSSDYHLIFLYLNSTIIYIWVVWRRWWNRELTIWIYLFLFCFRQRTRAFIIWTSSFSSSGTATTAIRRRRPICPGPQTSRVPWIVLNFVLFHRVIRFHLVYLVNIIYRITRTSICAIFVSKRS